MFEMHAFMFKFLIVVIGKKSYDDTESN